MSKKQQDEKNSQDDDALSELCGSREAVIHRFPEDVKVVTGKPRMKIN